MNITVNVAIQGPPPPAASPVRVELRDTSLADAPSVMLAEARTIIHDNRTVPLASVQFDLASIPRGTTAWAHVDVDRDGKVSSGDYITTASFPVHAGLTTVTVYVRKV